jgi:cardiolipin synthase
MATPTDGPIQPARRPTDGPAPAEQPARHEPLPAPAPPPRQYLPALREIDPTLRAQQRESSLSASLTALARHEVRLSEELGRTAVGGNSTEILLDGKQAYAAMFEAIESARDHINIESYIVEAEGPGEQLAQLLTRKCAEGVRVNLIYDSWGSWTTSAEYFGRLRKCGVQLCEYGPVLPWRHWRGLFNPAAWNFNTRDHRKLLIVDGRVAFTGGINISSVYSSQWRAEKASGTSKTQDPYDSHWRDTHVRIEGPVVAELQKLYLDQWRKQTGKAAQAARYFPSLAAAGPYRIMVAAAGSRTRRSPFYRALLAAIGSARSRICITVGYFVPTRRLARALIDAVERGVDVCLVLPGFSDAPAALHAGRSHYGPLLARGVRIYEHCEALLHAKTTVIDGAWASVGSHNMDWRSFVHNEEANVIVLSASFARELETIFQRDIAACRQITLADWQARGRLVRAKEWLARQVEYLL